MEIVGILTDSGSVSTSKGRYTQITLPRHATNANQLEPIFLAQPWGYHVDCSAQLAMPSINELVALIRPKAYSKVGKACQR